MNKFIILLLIMGCINSINAQWQIQNSGTNSNLTSVCFVGDETGWAVGSEGIILHTNDGGDNWILQTSGTDFDLEGVCFKDSLNGWIVGGSGRYSYPQNGIILHTNDGGCNWEIKFNDTAFHLNDVAFTDSLNIWAVGERTAKFLMQGTIVHSDDGGITWYRQEPFWITPLECIQFVNSDTGWIAGGGYAGSSGYPTSQIFRTTDAGIIWEEQVSVTGLYTPFNSIYFIDPDHGWAVGSHSYRFFLIPNLLQTEDGGIKWDSSYCTVPSVLKYYLEDVFFINQDTGWVVGERFYETGIIMYTEDGGASWNEQDTPTNWKLNSVSFVAGTKGWIVGDSGTILHTDNAGVSIGDLSNNEWNRLQVRIIPNPFTTTTTLSYTLDKPENVQFTIYNVQSQIVYMMQEKQDKGEQQVQWNAEGLPAGMYYFRIQAGSYIGSGKMILLD